MQHSRFYFIGASLFPRFADR